MAFKRLTPGVLIGSFDAQRLALALNVRALAFYDGLSTGCFYLGFVLASVTLSRVRVFVRAADTFGVNESLELELRSISATGSEDVTPLVTLDAVNVPAPGDYEVATDVQVQELSAGTVMELVTTYNQMGPLKNDPHLSVAFYFY